MAPSAFASIGGQVLAGVAIAVAAAWAGAHFQRRKDRAASTDQALQTLYLKLLDLRTAHFSVASAELRRREVNPRALAEVERIRYGIGDLLRLSPGLREQKRILEVIFGMSYRSEIERHHAIDRVADRIGRRANPRHAKAMRRVIRQNERELARDPEEYMRRLYKVGPP